MNEPAADRNLLFGILALQMDFIDRDQLVAAMHAWVLDKKKPLGDILVANAALSASRRRILDELVDEHAAKPGGIQASIVRLGVDPRAAESLAAIGDADLQKSLAGTDPDRSRPQPTAGNVAKPGSATPEIVGALPADWLDGDRINLQTLDLPAELTSISSVKLGDKTVHYFGPYQLHERIGSGGMGIVFRATHTQLKRVCALKMIRSGNLSSNKEIERFKVEAEAAARLDHPGIVPIFDVGVHLGQHYFAMAYVDGESLSQRVRGGPLEPKLAAELVRQAALAVQHAHDRGIVHRDIKPANILVSKPSTVTPVHATAATGKKIDPTPNAATPNPPAASGSFGSSGAVAAKLTDFGLAKMLDSSGGEQLTKTGDVMGTPSYMAPEQAAGKLGAVGPLADIYGLGAVMYHLLTGRPPFQAANVHETIVQVLEKEPVSVRELNAAVPRDLQTICHKCLQKDPAKRYASASELAADIGRFQKSEPIEARPVGRGERLLRWSKRNPAVAGLATGLLLALAAGVAVSATYAVQASRAAQNKEDEARRANQQTLLAKESEAKAKESEAKAKQSEARAKAAKRESDALLYASHMLLAQSAFEAKNIDLTKQLLGRYDHKYAQGEDPRGFEWHYWKARLQEDLATLAGHEACVTSVSFSPNGARLASGSWDRTIKLWDARTGQLHSTLAGHSGAVESVSFSSDGARLASGSGDNSIKLWDARTGQLQATLTGHASVVTRVCFSPDGARLASGSSDKTIKLWDARTGQLQATLAGHASLVTSVTFSPDGARLASGSHDKIIKLWDARAGQLQATLAGHTEPVLSVSFSPDGARLASGSDDKTIKLWDARTGQLQATLAGHASFVFSVSFSPDGARLASGSNDRTIKLWDARTGQLQATLAGHTEPVLSVSFSPDGARLASGSDDKTIKLWDARTDAKSRSEERVRKTVLAQFELPMTQADMIQQIEKGPILPDDLKPSALAMAKSMPDDWRRLVKGARNYALFESMTPKVRQRAVQLAEVGCQLSRDDDAALTALGIAQFRAGDAAKGLATLKRRKRANEDSETLCVEAMLQKAVGLDELAVKTLAKASRQGAALPDAMKRGFEVSFAEAEERVLGADPRKERLKAAASEK